MDSSPCTPLSIGQAATLACLLEAAAPKPGNVHRGADFEDLCFNDFVCSAVALGPAMDKAMDIGVGQGALEAVRATRELVNTNTNLGCALLIAPLAAVPRDQDLAAGVVDVLKALTADDSEHIYEAIRVAMPSAMGTVHEMDISGAAPPSLISAMKQAADRDLVARQYTNNFNEVLTCVVPWLVEGQQNGWTLTTAIIHSHLKLMSEYPDSLISRKCGQKVANESANRARCVLDSGSPGEQRYQDALSDLDFWLRSDGHRRNPGTSADLVAAGLFAALRDGKLVIPYR